MGASTGGYRGGMADIRDATLADAGAVFDLLATRSRAAFGMSELARDTFDAEYIRDGTDRWVAYGGADLVGYAHLGPNHAFVCAAVDPEVNDALLEPAEARAHERGFDTLELTAVRRDEPLWALAERGGFTHS